MTVEVVSERIKLPILEDANEEMGCYWLKPLLKIKVPSVILCAGLDGITPMIEQIALRIAQNGYMVIIPDFFHRVAPCIELQQRCFCEAPKEHVLKQLSQEDIVSDLIVAQRFLQQQEFTTEQMGIIGLCLGGHIAYIGSSHFPFRFTGLFDPISLLMDDFSLNEPKNLYQMTSKIQKLKGQLLCCWGIKNEEQICEKRKEFRFLLSRFKLAHQFYEFSDTGRGMLYENSAFYNVESAQMAWQKLLESLHSALYHPYSLQKLLDENSMNFANNTF